MLRTAGFEPAQVVLSDWECYQLHNVRSKIIQLLALEASMLKFRYVSKGFKLPDQRLYLLDFRQSIPFSAPMDR